MNDMAVTGRHWAGPSGGAAESVPLAARVGKGGLVENPELLQLIQNQGPQKKTLEQPVQVPTWHDTNDVLSDLGSIMLILMRLGVGLREHKRLEVTFQHNTAIEHMLKGAEKLKEAAVATMVGGALSLGISVVMASASMRSQKTASDIKTNINSKKANISKNRELINDNGIRINQLKQQNLRNLTQRDPQQLARNNVEIRALENSNLRLERKNMKLERKGLELDTTFDKAQNLATLQSQFVMPLGNFVNSIGGGMSQYLQSEKAVEDAEAQEHSKVSDLASQDYQHFEDFFKDVLSLLQGVISEMNQAVRSATQV